MALTPEDIETQRFKVARRGYDKVEVDRFMSQVATSYRDAVNAAAAPAATQPLPQRVPVATTAAAEPDPAEATAAGGELFAFDRPENEPAGDNFNRLGSEVANVLRTAHHSVATLRHEAEVEAAVIRQRAEREIADLRRDADEYATRVRAEADVYAADRSAEANFSTREADRILAEAQARADANLADTERRITAITEQAEAIAAARTAEIMADANRRLAVAQSTEQALREQLIGAHGDLAAALTRFPAEDDRSGTAGPADQTAVLDLTDDTAAAATSTPVIDLSDDAVAAEQLAEPPVPAGWPGAGPDTGRLDNLFGDDRGGTTVTAERRAPAQVDAAVSAQEEGHAEPTAATDAVEDDDPLADVVKDAIGKAVRNALNREQPAEG